MKASVSQAFEVALFGHYDLKIQQEAIKNGARLMSESCSGTEMQAFQIDDVVTHTGTGKYRANVKMTITDAYEVNGYFWYQDENGTAHRQKDLTK